MGISSKALDHQSPMPKANILHDDPILKQALTDEMKENVCIVPLRKVSFRNFFFVSIIFYIFLLVFY